MIAILRALTGRYFWITAYLAIGAGVLWPGSPPRPDVVMPILLGTVLFCTCLKVSLTDIGRAVAGVAGCRRLALLVVLKLLILPLPVFLVAWALAGPWAAGLLLVAAMPAGVTSAVFTDVQEGDVALALVVILATSLVAPLTVPPLLAVAAWSTGAVAEPIPWSALLRQTLFLALMLFLPFSAAQAVRRWWPAWTARHQPRFTPVALAANAVLLAIATASTRWHWIDRPGTLLWPLGAVSVASLFFLVCGRIMRRWAAPPVAIAFTCNAVYMNNGLGMVFAMVFFPDRPDLLLPSLVMAVPMTAVVFLVRPWLKERTWRPEWPA